MLWCWRYADCWLGINSLLSRKACSRLCTTLSDSWLKQRMYVQTDSCRTTADRMMRLQTKHLKGKGKEGHTAKERRRGAYLPFIGRWARRWLNHYCLWRMVSANSGLRLPFELKSVLISPTHRWMAGLSWPGWLVTYRNSLPARKRSPIQALTGPSVE